MRIWKNGSEQIKVGHGVDPGMRSNMFVVDVRPCEWTSYHFILCAGSERDAIALLKRNAEKVIEGITKYCRKEDEWRLEHKLSRMKDILASRTKFTAERIDGDRAIPVSYWDDSRSVSSL